MVGGPCVRARQAQPGEAQADCTTITRWCISLECDSRQRGQFIQHSGHSSSPGVSQYE